MRKSIITEHRHSRPRLRGGRLRRETRRLSLTRLAEFEGDRQRRSTTNPSRHDVRVVLMLTSYLTTNLA
jgi:hypothetical protein